MTSEERQNPLRELLDQGEAAFLPNISVDNVIFGYAKRELKVLLLQASDNLWMLPGGYILKQESLDQAAKRNLEDRLGLSEVYVKQFYAFGNSKRSFSNEILELFEQLGASITKDSWIAQRFVSIGYYSLVHMKNCTPNTGLFANDYGWFDVNAVPKLLFDHYDILNKALKTLQDDTKDFPLPFHLLHKEFTMPELHAVFETIYNKKIDRSRFQKKMFSYGVFERLEVLNKTVPHRKPYVYHAKSKK